MVWSEAKDFIMLKEVAAEGVFDNKPGSKDRGSSYSATATTSSSLIKDNTEKRVKFSEMHSVSMCIKDRQEP